MNGRMLKALRGLWLLAVLLPAQAQEVYYIHTDALGSPVAETDASRNVVVRFEYEPYGRRIGPGNDDKPGHTGHVMDAVTGLVQMQQRSYDPGIGMFLSVDPVTAYSNPVGQFHRYRYANNNPYRFTDPDGRISKELKRQGYEEIGDGFVVRVDSVRGPGGESVFEVHVYEDSKAFQKAAEGGDTDALRKAEVNTLKTNGEWGKHGKPSEAPDLGKRGQAGFDRVVQREVNARGWTTKGSDGRLRLRDNLRQNLGKFGRYLGPAGVLLEYTRSSVDRACDIDPSNEAC